jgi:hypothetical protein
LFQTQLTKNLKIEFVTLEKILTGEKIIFRKGKMK